MSADRIKSKHAGIPRRSEMPVTVSVRVRFFAILLIAVGLSVAPVRAAGVASQKHPDVIAATAKARDADTFDFDVTVSSPYDTPQRYADGFRVAGKGGEIYGERNDVLPLFCRLPVGSCMSVGGIFGLRTAPQ